MDTAMHRAEGDLDPRGNALILYGTLDEERTKVIEMRYRRKS